MLKIADIDVFYGKIQALKGVSIDVKPGEIVTLIGANGAGKSTVLRSISGLETPTRGSIEFQGQTLVKVPPEAIVSKGISHVPEGRRVFPGLTVYENLEIGATVWRKRSDDLSQDLEQVYNLFPRLKERSTQLAWSLSGGEQQMLAIGRAIMARPKLLLLDEPSLGLSPVLVEQVFEVLKKINDQGMTMLLVEQNAYMALEIAHRGYVIENGKIVLDDNAAALGDNPKVKAAYLGG
ncbi:MAG: ABC transporter ATP-binding protein [Negativicutes bacterium]|nr:ABC transporter ATP-binding protein [Negativicutes bacterium]